MVDAPTPELVEEAANRLRQALQAKAGMFLAVRQPQSGSFFEHSGLLYLSTAEVNQVTAWLTRADALIGTLAADETYEERSTHCRSALLECSATSLGSTTRRER